MPKRPARRSVFRYVVLKASVHACNKINKEIMKIKENNKCKQGYDKNTLNSLKIKTL